MDIELIKKGIKISASQGKKGLQRKLASLLIAFSLILAACAGPGPAASQEAPQTNPVAATATVDAQDTAIPETPEPVSTNISSEIPTLDAVVVTLEANEDEINGVLEFSTSKAPLLYNEGIATYELICVLESINFLHENSYIPLGNHEITVTGECSYLDVNGEKQTVTVALVIQDPVNKTTWMPYSEIQPFITRPNLIQETFSQFSSIEPGSVIVVLFGTPNQKSQKLLGGEYNAEASSSLYTDEVLTPYVNTGNSEYLNGKELIPFDIIRFGLQPHTN